MSAKTRTTIAIRFPPDVHERLQEAAEERDLSMNFLVVRAVTEFLGALLPAEEIEWTRPREKQAP